MTELVDGLTGSVDQILTADPIVDEGVTEPFKWKVDMANPDGIIATAKHGPRTYTVTVEKVRVSVKKDTHAEIEAAAAAAPKEKPAVSAAEKKAIEDTETVAEFAPDTKTKKEAEKLLSKYRK